MGKQENRVGSGIGHALKHLLPSGKLLAARLLLPHLERQRT